MGAKAHKGHIVHISGKCSPEKLTPNRITTSPFQIIGYVCSIEAVILAALTKCPSQYRHVIDDYSDMCLEERELSPICSNELTNIANNTTATTDNNNINATELSNHRNYNNNKTTETGDSVTPTCNQKPYIPGECTVYNSLPMIVKKAAMKDLRRYIFVEAAPA